MSFFKDFKEDLSQAVNELLPGDDMGTETKRPELVNTLEDEIDAKSEMEKIGGLFEKVQEESAEMKAEEVIPEDQNEIKVEYVTAEEPENKEETIVNEESVMEAESVNNTVDSAASMETESSMSSEISDEVTIITEGTSLKGDLESTGSFELRGRLEGNVRCNGKMTITGALKGNAQAAEFFADSAKVEGEVSTSGTVKIGLGSVVVGNISATSAVIAGAIKGDIDVQGPVVVDTSAVVMGNIKSRSVQINNGAVIEGFCSQCYAEVDMDSFFSKK